MTSRERRAKALDTGQADEPLEATALTLAEAAEAEAAAAEADARAAAARARAIRLRHQAEATQPEVSDAAETPDPDGAGDLPVQTIAPSRRLRRGRPSGKTAAVAAAVLLICAALSASGYLAWQHRIASQHRQRVAEFADAARQDVVAFMSLDPQKTKEDMKRIADNSTGTLKNNFPAIADELTNGLERSKVTTTVTVNDVAVESMTNDSAIVLVAATTEAKVPDGPTQTRSWHISMGLRRNGGQPKMSHVEFVR
jgi:Mce-associated membrane protein